MSDFVTWVATKPGKSPADSKLDSAQARMLLSGDETRNLLVSP
jgi:hypothetical protein